MSNNLIILSALVLLPLIPAFLLFKMLPSKAVVKGPLAGLNVDLGGAFGGYVALTVFLATFYTTKMTAPETWTVQGELEAAGAQELPVDLTVKLKPPSLAIEDGRFEFEVPVSTSKKPLNLVFEARGYESAVVRVKGPDGKIQPGGAYDQKIYKSSQTIVLEKPVVMRKKETVQTTDAAQSVGAGS
jgi:hypothetical protein